MVRSPATAHPPKTALRDPVCGMSVCADAEFRTEHAGREYLFCSRDCRDRFQANPERYLPETSADPAASSDEAADTPMTLHRRATRAAGKRRALRSPCPDGSCATGVPLYTCPMHPEVRQGHPGACPKCGMALEPRTLTVEEQNPELIDMTAGTMADANVSMSPTTAGPCGLLLPARQRPSRIGIVLARAPSSCPYCSRWIGMAHRTPPKPQGDIPDRGRRAGRHPPRRHRR